MATNMTTFTPQIITPIPDMPAVIESNLGELVDYISGKVEEAKNLVIDIDKVDDLEACEKEASKFNKIVKSVSNYRINLSKSILEPYETVIEQAKTVEKMAKEGAADLLAKAKEGRNKIRSLIKEALHCQWVKKLEESLFENNEHFNSFFDTMCDEKTKGSWTNRSKKDDDIYAEMDEEISRCFNAVKSFNSLYKEKSNAVRLVGFEALEKGYIIDNAINAVNDYEAQQLRIAEMQSRQNEECKPAATAHMTQDEPVFGTYNLRLTGTIAALFKLKAFCEENDITVVNLDKQQNENNETNNQ